MSENLDPSTDEFRALPLESRRFLSMQPEVRLQDNLMVKERDGRKEEMEESKSSFQWYFESGCSRSLTTQHISDHVAPTNS